MPSHHGSTSIAPTSMFDFFRYSSHSLRARLSRTILGQLSHQLGVSSFCRIVTRYRHPFPTVPSPSPFLSGSPCSRQSFRRRLLHAVRVSLSPRQPFGQLGRQFCRRGQLTLRSLQLDGASVANGRRPVTRAILVLFSWGLA